MNAKTDTPSWIRTILTWAWLSPISRIALVSAFLIGGIQKIIDFPGAVAEQAHFGLQPAWLWATAAIVVELVGSALDRTMGVARRWRSRCADCGRYAYSERFLGEDRS